MQDRIADVAAPESLGRRIIMNMKYFRFLYGGMKSCMIHFGEVNDTKSKETFTFLFIRGSETQNEQKEQRMEQKQYSPFLIPESVDLAVLGNVNESVKTVWNELQKNRKVRTLIVPDIPDVEHLYREHVDEVIRLRPVCWEKNVPEKTDTNGQWNTVAAGWQFQVVCRMEGVLAVWHDAADCSSKNLQEGNAEIREFTDCVMSVKATENSMCCEKQNPDQYGCALGCVLHRDYDVCKFRYENRANPYLTGTVLMAGKGETDVQDAFLRRLSEKTDSIRFFSVQNPEEITGILNGKNQSESGMRRYVIELDDEVCDHMASTVFRTGLSISPVLLKEGQGVCCSGFLKYADA